MTSLINRLLVKFASALISAYRYFLSPYWGTQCRFYPTCSVYAQEALQEHGFTRGTWLTTKRLARCHPWCDGGIDEVPRKDPILNNLIKPSATMTKG
jgi:uncharacterized protein